MSTPDITPDESIIDIIARRAHDVLASTPLESGDYIAHGLWGHELASKLADEAEREQLYLLDIRSREAYEAGHIEGSHHVEFPAWAAPENLAALPRNRKIIVICDNGLAAAQVVAGLRLLGYDAAVPRTGINGWAETPMTARLIEEFKSVRYPVRRVPPRDDFTPAPTGVDFAPPEGSHFDVIAARVHEVFSTAAAEEHGPHTVSAARLHEMLTGGDESEGVYLLDLRREEDFEGVGHIEGSQRLDFDAAAVPQNLERLPRDRKIVTICYTGNLAAQLALVLRLLGYDAAALAYGMVAWTRTPTTHLYLKDIQKADNPLVQPDPNR